jgi:ABC-type microcin C transport system duplicated ATPase subunit YejF
MPAIELVPDTPVTLVSTLLSVRNIELIYDRIILVLIGESLDVPKGVIVALLGANGAGKTACPLRRSRPLATIDRDHPLRSIATSVMAAVG